MSAAARARQVAAAIRQRPFRYSGEDQLQQGLAGALAADGWQVEREVRLDSRCRIDLVTERVGIEVKVAGTPADVLRQLRRYAGFEQLEALVLVTTRARHSLIPTSIDGKPVEIVNLAVQGL